MTRKKAFLPFLPSVKKVITMICRIYCDKWRKSLFIFSKHISFKAKYMIAEKIDNIKKTNKLSCIFCLNILLLHFYGISS